MVPLLIIKYGYPEAVLKELIIYVQLALALVPVLFHRIHLVVGEALVGESQACNIRVITTRRKMINLWKL